jgi:2,3-bisphosphoglycerate-dependent phosphoglycerate mutase
LWTGRVDVSLAPEGIGEAKAAGSAIADIFIHVAHTSLLKRAKETLSHAMELLHHPIDTITHHEALNERDYGDYTGKNKWEVKELVGEEHFNNIRRGWNVAVPNGETLQDVYNRVVPYYQDSVVPDLIVGKNVLVVAHGNSLRALVKHLENIHDDDIAHVEIGTGEVHVYELDGSLAIKDKNIRSLNDSA